MSFQKFFRTAIFLAFSCSSSIGFAGIIYDESVSGDLGEIPANPELLLGVGANSIFGTAEIGDTDDFLARAAAGLNITGAHFTAFYGGTTGSGFYNSSNVPLVGGGSFLGFFTGNVSIDIAAISVGEGLFRVQNSPNNNAPVTWRFDFTVVDPAVATVPEPASFAVWGIASLGLVALRRKRRLA